MVGITKRFPGVVANEGVGFEAAVGEVHALLGENGAGKTTLSNILTGLYRPDEGQIELYGQQVRFQSPRDALDAGVGMVHQHFRLVEPFTVAQNVVLGDTRGEGSRFLLRGHAIEDRVAELSRRYGLVVNPKARMWQLSVGEQQRVEILKALHRDARILIMDEPTAVLTPQEAEALFGTLRAMADAGKTVIFISHKLYEVLAVADRVTILRGGRAVTTVDVKGSTARSLAALMVGRELEVVRRPAREAARSEDVVLSVAGLSVPGDWGRDSVDDVSLEVRAREVLGIAGVAGNGQRELADAISGMRAPSAGEIRVAGRALKPGDPRDAIAAGVAYVPEDRLGTGLAPSLSIARNAVLKTYRKPPVSRGPIVVFRRMAEVARALIAGYDIKAPSLDSPARNLSGGNLQKLILGREFQGAPKLFVVAQPTRGLDVGAIETVHGYIFKAAESGAAVLLLSEDLEEILALSDRVVVIYEGRVAGELDARSATAEEIGFLMAGGGRE